MKNMFGVDTIVERPPLVAEVIGPAGVGKTTLLQALKQPRIRILEGVRIKKIKNIPLVVSNAAFLLVKSLCEYRQNRLLTYKEAKLVLHLKVWHDVLRREPANSERVTVFDHGPMTRWVLRKHPPDMTNSHNNQVYEQLFDSLLNEWVSTLDVVIWLDAPVATLVERIHARNKWHRVKEKSEQEAYKILKHYRSSCEQIIAKVTANSGTRVLYFDTERESLKQIVKKILAEFDLDRSQG